MHRTIEPMTKTDHPGALPDGYRARPGSMDDLPAAVGLCDMNERRVLGKTTGFSRRFNIFWTSPDCDVPLDVRVVEAAAGQIVGFVQLSAETPYVQARMTGHVHPEHAGRGVGTHLVDWSVDRARQLTERGPADARLTLHEFVMGEDERAGALLSDRGFVIARHFVFMLTDLVPPLEPPVWPEGIELRPVTWEEHGRVISDADNEIFLDHWGFAPKSDDDSYQHFRHWVENDPEYDPALWFVAWAGEEIAGLALCWPKGEGDPEKGYVGVLGVRRRWRGKGLGLALLRHSFGHFYRLGRKQCALHADAENLTGAVRLYTKAGMHIHRRYDIFEKELRPGRELARQTLDT